MKGIKILAKTCVFISHHSIQHGKASGYIFFITFMFYVHKVLVDNLVKTKA